MKSNSITTEGTEQSQIKGFDRYGFQDELFQAITKMQWEQTTQVQRKVLPNALKGRHIVASAQTGSGKTGAYALPIIQSLLSNTPSNTKTPINAPDHLILVPTTELAVQVATVFQTLSKYSGNQFTTVIVDASRNIKTQIKEFKEFKPNVIVATPGRLLRILEHKGALDLNYLKTFVIDECDRMLDLSMTHLVFSIWRYIPKPSKEAPGPQYMLFTATLVPEVHNFVLRLAPNHELIHLNERLTVPPTIKQVLYTIPAAKKTPLFLYFLKRKGDANVSFREKKMLVFMRTAARAKWFASFLQKEGYFATALHAELTKTRRKNLMKEFEATTGTHIDILVTTDLMGRGIDIPNIDYVVNFDLPMNPEDYIHRVGRTGRAGRKGVAVTFAVEEPQLVSLQGHPLKRDDLATIQEIENLTESKLERRKIPGTWKSRKLKPSANEEPFTRSEIAKMQPFRDKMRFHMAKTEKENMASLGLQHLTTRSKTPILTKRNDKARRLEMLREKKKKEEKERRRRERLGDAAEEEAVGKVSPIEKKKKKEKKENLKRKLDTSATTAATAGKRVANVRKIDADDEDDTNFDENEEEYVADSKEDNKCSITRKNMLRRRLLRRSLLAPEMDTTEEELIAKHKAREEERQRERKTKALEQEWLQEERFLKRIGLEEVDENDNPLDEDTKKKRFFENKEKEEELLQKLRDYEFPEKTSRKSKKQQ